MANERDAISPPDLSVTLSLWDPILPEGSSSGSGFTCTMTITGDLSVERKVYWRLVGSGDHPTNDADFSNPSDWVIFEPGEITKDFGFWVSNDIALEPDETFIVTAFDPVSQSNYGTPAEGTILTDDTNFAITALTPSLREGTGSVGGTEFLFEMIRSGELSQTQVLPWKVKADSARASDFVAACCLKAPSPSRRGKSARRLPCGLPRIRSPSSMSSSSCRYRR
jgi:hypothetical protein